MRKLLLLLTIITIPVIKVWSQAEIISIIPSLLLKSQTVNIVIKGENTHFSQGITMLNAGNDIVVKSINVSSSVLLTATISVNNNAKIAYHKLTVTTGSEKIEVEEAFEVIETGTELSAIINLMPVNNLFLSDFDPNNIKNAPLIFTIQINNDNQLRNLNVVLSIFNDEYGKFAGADKKIKDLAALSSITFSNRDFDNYNVNSSADKLFQLASQTGMLPPGNYRYLIEVFDENNIKIAEDDVSDYISNDFSDIELIAPGSQLDFSPEIIASYSPFFQWFSQANLFDFTLYEVLQGQKSKDEIISNTPVYQLKNITSKALIYPNSAEKLDPRKTYAWIISAHYNSLSGEKTILSDMLWFNINEADKQNIQIISLDVEPELITIAINEKINLHAFGTDDKGEKIPLNCTWRVIPEIAGSINQNGEFTAGKYPLPAAVVAEYQGVIGYSTVNILWDINNSIFDIGKLFDQIFGIQNK